MKTLKLGFWAVIIISFFSVNFLFAEYKLPDTGQIISFTDIFGEDSDYPRNPLSYVKLDSSGNSLPDDANVWVMVKDNNTGLIWEVKTNDGGINDKNNYYNWNDAQDIFINELNNKNFGGYSDWRLPTTHELVELLNYNSYLFAINDFYFKNTWYGGVWTSIERINQDYAWWMYCERGVLQPLRKSDLAGVRAVRGQKFFSTFDLQDEIVIDRKNSIMWSRHLNGPMTWEDALSYCENLSFQGYEDWKLPNIKELFTIINYGNIDAIDKEIFWGPYDVNLWSSTTRKDNVNQAWVINFSGDSSMNYTDKNIAIYFRVVRKIDNQQPTANAGLDQSVHVGNLVTLDGSLSSDPDENYPLTYQWEFEAKPFGSMAVFSDTGVVNPTFTVDMEGEYVARLTVTDSKGLSSEVDYVVVSTYNTAPTADAGPDQFVIEIGTQVFLDASGSYDEDGDDITLAWTIEEKPAGSLAELDDFSLEFPSFLADVNGDYLLKLVVADSWATSEPDYIKVSFNNIAPVAVAGQNQSVLVGETVLLDGGESYDANLDSLNYSWSLVSAPDGSLSIISSPTSQQVNLIPDLPGIYVLSLVVSDGLLTSTASNVTVVAISYQTAVTNDLEEAIDAINTIDVSVFKNKKQVNALTNKLNAVLESVDQGDYVEALDKLQNDILKKTNGCAEGGAPDNNDWIRDCESQNQIYPIILETIALLQTLIE